MFKHYFERIENIETGPVIALILFFVIFMVMAIWIFRLDKKFINKMKNLPLEDDDIKQNKE